MPKIRRHKAMLGEPALILGALAVTFDLIAAFVFDLDARQLGALNGAAAAWLSLAIRRKVEPIDRGR